MMAAIVDASQEKCFARRRIGRNVENTCTNPRCSSPPESAVLLNKLKRMEAHADPEVPYVVAL